MTSMTNEDELLDTLTWSDTSFTLAEFIDEHELPQVVKVVRGYDGGTDSSTLGYGEVLTLHAVRETPMLEAEDGNENAITIALDCPYKLQILPQSKDCSFGKCEVKDLPSIYPKVKYIQVTQAHYGAGKDEDSTSSDELLEILNINKSHKKIKVKDVNTGQIFSLSSSCTAEFRPLLDWKNYSAKDVKAQFGFPLRARLVINDDDKCGKESTCLKLVSKTPDVILVGETVDRLVVTTTVGSCTDLKFCYEIPKDLQVKVAVAEGFLKGDKHYQDVVESLDKGFNAVRLMSTYQPEFFKRRDTIKQYSYDAIAELFLNISVLYIDVVAKEEDAPVLPPRRRSFSAPISPSVPLSPPVIPEKPGLARKTSASTVTDNTNSKPAIAPRQKPKIERLTPELRKVQEVPAHNVLPQAKSVPEKPSSTRLSPPPRQNSSGSDDTPTVRSQKPPPPPCLPKITDNSSHSSTLSKTEETKPSLVHQSGPPMTSPKPLKRPAKIPETAIKVFPAVSESQESTYEPVCPNDAPIIQLKPPLPAWKVIPAAPDVPRVPPNDPKASQNVPQKPPPHLPKVTTSSSHSSSLSKSEETKPSLVHESVPPMTSPKSLKSPPKIPEAAIKVLPPVSESQESTYESVDPSDSPMIPLKPPLPPQKDVPRVPPNDPKASQNVSRAPSVKPPLRPSKIATSSTQPAVIPKSPMSPPRVQKPPANPNAATKPEQTTSTPLKKSNSKTKSGNDGTTRKSFPPKLSTLEKVPNKANNNEQQPNDHIYQELKPLESRDNEIIHATLKTVTITTTSSDSVKDDDKSSLSYTLVTEGSQGTGWETEDPYAMVARIPQDLSGLSVEEVCRILRNLNMERYVETFEHEMIDGDLLKFIQEEDLVSLNVESFHCKKLMKFINGWRPKR